MKRNNEYYMSFNCKLFYETGITMPKSQKLPGIQSFFKENRYFRQWRSQPKNLGGQNV